MSVISFDHVWKRFGATTALEDVCLELAPGHIVGLLGDNGAGKSTLIRNAIGLYLPDRGACRTFGVAVDRLGPAELARIGYVHQGAELLLDIIRTVPGASLSPATCPVMSRKSSTPCC